MAFGDVVQSNTGTSTLATTTPTLASPTTAGNIVVLTFAADDYNGTPDTGWTQSSEMGQQTFHGGYLWWMKCAGADPIPGYTIGSAVRSTWTLVEYEGPFDTSPYDVSEGQFAQSSSNSYTTANATPTAGGRLLVAGLNAQHASADLAAWAGFTNSFTQAASSLFNGANPRLSIAQLKLVVTANGSTAYSTGGSHGAQVSQSRSGLIISFKKGAAGTAYTLTAAPGTFALSGNATTLRAARQLAAATGARTLTGVAANLRRGFKIPAAAGSFVLSGAAAGLKRAYVLSAAAVAFTLSGKAANLSFGHRLVSAAGSFALSGQSATLRYGRQLSTASASFALLGYAANLVYMPSGVTYVLTAWTGSFGLAGQTAALRSGRQFVSANGAFALTGQNAGLKAGRVLRSSQGSFAFAGQAASLRAERKLASVKGSFVLTGFDATLTKGGGLSYTLVADTGLFVLSGQNATLTYLPLPGIRNPLERLKMYTGSMGSVSNREDWIVNISLVGDDGTSFDLTGAEIVAYVCREGCSNNPVLSASLGNGIVLTDNYTMQWHFDESQMASLCPQQYGVFCRVERDGITTQLLSANIAIVEGGPA